MGNAGSVSGEKAVVREFVLKVAMSCRCEGCARKLRSAVENPRLASGVVTVDRSATDTAEELRVLATADLERLRKRVSKAMDKKVHLVFPPPKPKPDLQRQAPPTVRRRNGGHGAGPANSQQQEKGLDWNNAVGNLIQAYDPPAPPYYQYTGPAAHAWGAPTPYDAYPAPAPAHQPGHDYRPPTPNTPPGHAPLHYF